MGPFPVEQAPLLVAMVLKPYLAVLPKVLPEGGTQPFLPFHLGGQLAGGNQTLMVAFPRFEEEGLAQLAVEMEFLFPFEEQNLEEEALLLH